MAGALLKYFATGADQPEMSDRGRIDALFRHHRIRIMAAITLGYGLIYTCRLALGVVKKPLIDAGLYTPSELGLIGSALFYTYALGKLTNGFLADHANMKRFLAFAFLMTALCNLAMGFTTTLWMAVVADMALGGFWYVILGALAGSVVGGLTDE